MKMRKMSIILVSMFLTFTMVACNSNKNINNDSSEKETVELKLWGAEEDNDLLIQIVDNFKNENSDQANFDIKLESHGEADCKADLLKDVNNGADVFAFADDQLSILAASGVLEAIDNSDKVKEDNNQGAVDAATINSKMYAYPMTADNGYFLYYNKQYFSDEDVKSLDKMLNIAKQNGKKISVDLSSGWYLYSFFGNAGLNLGLNDDGVTNHCDWNNAIGNSVAQYINSVVKSGGFISTDDNGLKLGLKDQTIIAGVSGVWLSSEVQKTLGDNFGATQLPSYNLDGKEVQMASFKGYKMIGVNSYSENIDWAMKLAEYITNEENQILRFQMRDQGPSNINAANSDDISKSQAIQAVLKQSEYAQLQRIGGNYWDDASDFGKKLASGGVSDSEIQGIMDNMVTGITASNIKK